MREIWLYRQVNIPSLSGARADVLFHSVDSEVKRRIESDIRAAEEDMEMYDKEKAKINGKITEIGEEDEGFKKRLVRLVLLALLVR